MRRDEVAAKLRKSPFVPFRLYISDGGVFDIRHPEMMMVVFKNGIDHHSTDSFSTYSLPHKSSRETVQPVQPGTPGAEP